MEEVTGESKSGLSRRALIKRGAVAGAAVWTAPIIIDSVASAAGAITGPPTGCTGMLFNGGNCNLENQGTPCSFTLCDQTNDDLLLPFVVLTGNCQNGTLTLSFVPGVNCQFTAAAAKSGSDCIPPEQLLPADSITFPVQASPGYAQHAVNVLCT